MNTDAKRMIKLRLKSLRAGLSKDYKIIFLASIFTELSWFVNNFIKTLGCHNNFIFKKIQVHIFILFYFISIYVCVHFIIHILIKSSRLFKLDKSNPRREEER